MRVDPLMEAEPALELVEWVVQAPVADRVAVVLDQAAPADLADALRTLSSTKKVYL